MKTCTKCGIEKPLSEFYKHPAGAFGCDSKCKDCAKAQAKAFRESNAEHYKAYDKARASRPDRVAARAAYQKTDAGKAAVARAKARYVEKNRAAINKRNTVDRLQLEQLERRRERGRAYMRSERGQASQERTNSKNPDRRAARVALGNAVRDGRVMPWPVCAVAECSGKPEAHHPDYDRPLDVVWLCQAHHKQAHALVQE